MRKSAKILFSVSLAIMLIASFFAGFFTSKLTSINSSASSLDWFIDTVNKYYYFGNAQSGYKESGLAYIADKYLDQYSAYYSAQQYNQVIKSNAGSKSGIGVSYSYIENKGIYIAYVAGNSPAYKAGLRAGEFLKSGKFKDTEVEFKSSSDFSSNVSKLTDSDKMTLTATSGRVYEDIYKADYQASYTYLATKSTAWIFADSADKGLAMYEKKEQAISYLPDDMAYIRIDQFYGTAGLEFYSLIEKFNAYNCTSLIIDLRSNGGGYVSVMQAIAGSFAEGEKKLAMLAKDKYENEDAYYCERVTKKEQQVKKGTKVYVLANSGTASASEALIGVLVCYGYLEYKNIFLSSYSQEYIDWLKSTNQEIKNERSYGKGIMQSTYINNATGEALKLTTAKIFWPDKVTSIHDRGLTVAQGCTPIPADWQRTIPDTELKNAITHINNN